MKLVYLEQGHYLPSVYSYLEKGSKVPNDIINFVNQLELVLAEGIIYPRNRLKNAVGNKRSFNFVNCKR